MREVVRCINCKLNQFVTVSGLCRKCKLNPFFVSEPEPEVTATIVEFCDFPVIHPNDITRALPTVFRACRAGSEMSQRELANVMGVPRTYISKIELDKATPTLKSFFGLCRGLNLSPRFILEMAEAMASA